MRTILSQRRRIVQQDVHVSRFDPHDRTHERIVCYYCTPLYIILMDPITERFRSRPSSKCCRCPVTAPITCPHPQVTDQVKTPATTTAGRQGCES